MPKIELTSDANAYRITLADPPVRQNPQLCPSATCCTYAPPA